MKKIVLVFILITNLCHGQLQNTWMLGHYLNPALPKCGIDFSNGAADTFSVFRTMAFSLENTMICDKSGDLLFYTNGIYIANRNHDTLQNSVNFNPGYGAGYYPIYGSDIEQGSVIVPMDTVSKIFYILHFTFDQFMYDTLPGERPLNFRYSKVDMSLDNGFGGIDPNKKAVTIFSDTLIWGKTTACRHANGRDWWVVTHKLLSDKFYTLLVTPDTIIVNDQTIGVNPQNDIRGQAVFSPDGTKYVLLTRMGIIQLFDFDRCTGLLSDFQQLWSIDSSNSFYGASISPNSRFLYTNTSTRIYQYDLLSSNIDSSGQVVADWDTVSSPFPTIFSNQQLGPDGKIYIGTWHGCDVLHCITSPDSSGLSCNVQQNLVKLPARYHFLPTYPNYGLGSLTGSPCDTLTAINNINTTNIQLNLFPNPATNYVNITYQFKTNEQALFTLYNSMGQEVVRKTLYGAFKSLLLHTNTYNAGMYYYKVVMKNKMVQTGKLVIGR